MLDGIVGRVQVVRKRREFGGDGVDLLDEGRYISLETEAAYSEFGGADAPRDLTI